MRYFLLVLILVALPVFGGERQDKSKIDREAVEQVQKASYRMYVRISPPGRRVFQTMAFCSSSFYEYKDAKRGVEEGIYGTTAGHCLDAYKVARERLKDRWWGLKFDLVVSPNNDAGQFITVEPVSDGFRTWRHWQEDDEGNVDRPSPSAVNDWGVIRAPKDANLNTLELSEPDTVRTGDRIYISGFPYALGKFWSSGQATYPYQLPGTPYDDYIASDAGAAPGNSGSPVVDAKGKQVGILVAGIPGGPSLITPIDLIKFPQDYPYSSGGSGSYSGFGYETLGENVEIPEDMDQIYKKIESWVESEIDNE